jgi:branched-chain amino acid transport system substrate-binding protein
MSTKDPQQEFIDERVQAAVTRRHFLNMAGKVGLGSAALGTLSGGFLAGCATGGKSTSSGGGGGGDTLKVGVVAPFSGVASFVGKVVDRSLDAAVAQLNATGGIGGRKVTLTKIDTGVDPQNGPKAYNDLVSQGVVGILWCLGAGFDPQTTPLIKRDGMPVIAVFDDLAATRKLYPEGTAGGRSVFQLADNARLGLDVAMDYIKNDRGYASAAYIYDTTLDPQNDSKRYFADAAAAAGVPVTGIETFALADAEYGAQLQRLKAQRPQVLFLGGISANTAGIAKELAALDASYVDGPTAKGPGWHPHIMGSPAGTGDKSWIELAGDAAKVGTGTIWHVSGLIGTPGFPIAEWSRKYLNQEVTGGEEVPADGLATLLYGIKQAGSTDRAKIVDAIETMGSITFASIDFSFAPDRHIAHTKDDFVVVTMERRAGPAPTDPPYQLGTEWKAGIFKNVPAGPTHLVRPTLAANQRAHPAVMDAILKGGYGTQCTKHADGSLGKECKIH